MKQIISTQLSKKHSLIRNASICIFALTITLLLTLSNCSKKSTCGILNDDGTGDAPSLNISTNNGPVWANKGICKKSGNTRVITATFKNNALKKVQITWDATTQKPDAVGNIFANLNIDAISYTDDAGRVFTNTLAHKIQIIEESKSRLDFVVPDVALFSPQAGSWIYSIGGREICFE
jgi:plasmid maintenance system killer protein